MNALEALEALHYGHHNSENPITVEMISGKIILPKKKDKDYTRVRAWRNRQAFLIGALSVRFPKENFEFSDNMHNPRHLSKILPGGSGRMFHCPGPKNWHSKRWIRRNFGI